MYCYHTEGYPGKREAITALASCHHFFTSTFPVEKEGTIEVKLCFIGTICLVSVCRHWFLFCLSLLTSSSLSGIVFSWRYLHTNQITSQSSFWEAKQIDLVQTYTVRQFLQPLNNFCSSFLFQGLLSWGPPFTSHLSLPLPSRFSSCFSGHKITKAVSAAVLARFDFEVLPNLTAVHVMVANSARSACSCCCDMYNFVLHYTLDCTRVS